MEVTDYDRPRRLATTTTMAAAQIRGALTFAPDPAGTVLRWSWDLRPKGALRLLGPVFAAQGRRQEAATWAGLKAHLEALSAARPAGVTSQARTASPGQGPTGGAPRLGPGSAAR